MFTKGIEKTKSMFHLTTVVELFVILTELVYCNARSFSLFLAFGNYD